jgi:hypothetical protein
MGEIADSLLDGTMCEGCGEFLDGESPGYPRYCSKQCASDRGVDYEDSEDVSCEDDEACQDFLSYMNERDEKLPTIKEALKEYKRLAFKFKCGKACQETNRGIKHVGNCKANKHKKLAREAWKIYKDYVE